MNTSTNLRMAVTAAAFLGLAGLVGSTGCNAILGNDDGTLAADAGGAATVANDIDGSFTVTNPTTVTTNSDGAVTSGDDDAQSDGGASTTTGDAATGMTAPTCDSNEVMCSGTCVETSNPIFGCGASSCSPCAIPRGTAACNAGKCVLAACDPGYADCNQDPSDGCETDLSQSNHCGACNATCAAAAPNCAPVGASFECTTGCTGTAPTLCGKQCVDLTSSATHCGSCTNACAAVPNGKTSCANSTCEFTCNNGFHACGSTCVSASSVNSCGTSCSPCAVPANAVASCTGGACGFTCNAGYGDCDKDAANGCEAMLVEGACPMPVVDSGMPDSATPPIGDASTD